jgi:pimeloyl-ACP methyl ester carboxylesterase
MRRYFTRLVIINALICAVFAAVFAIPIGRLEAGLVAGLAFGILIGLLVEAVFQRWKGRWLYQRRLLFLVLLEVLLTLYVLMPAYLAYFGLRPARIPVTAIPDELVDIAEEVTLETRDGIFLSGWYIPSQNSAVIILLHGLGSNRLGVQSHAHMLIEQGYGVLMMDMRAHGTSGGEIFADGWNSATDVSAMVEYLRARADVEHIGALGLSAGAVSILQAGAEDEAIEAFVADGTGVAAAADLLDPLTPHPAIAWLLVPDYWMSYRFTALFSGLDPAPPLREQVRRIAPRPILFIAGAESMWEAELATKYAASAGDSAEVWVVPNAGHIAGIHIAPDEYAVRVLGFLNAALLEEASHG